MIFVLGLDWKTASLEQRERFSIPEEQVAPLLHQVKEQSGVFGCVLLQTCNRFELYLDAESDAEASACSAMLLHSLDVTPQTESSVLFQQGQTVALRRLMEVACGLQSQILGEEQILSQVRHAISSARKAKAVTPALETLFRLAVTAGKSVRTHVRFQAVSGSSAHRAVELAEAQLNGLAGKRAVVIGNGEMGRLAAALLVAKKCSVTVTLRSYRHGQTVVPPGCHTVAYDDRYAAIDGCDLLISTTRSPHFTVTAPMMSGLAQLPRIIVDMALPRDVDPDCRQNVPRLYDMDDLCDQGAIKHSEEYRAAQAWIEKYLAEYEEWSRQREKIRQNQMAGGLAVFAGTSEGRTLCDHLARAGISAKAFVATEYGSAVLPEYAGIEVKVGRLSEGEMSDALSGCATVVDATHPYAVDVSRNLRSAARRAGIRYIRLFRPRSEISQDVVTVENTAAAAAYLVHTEGAVLLTTGSKELAEYTRVPDFEKRLYPRILPDADALQRCLDLGFPPSHVICMQGPFSHEMNLAMLQSANIKWLVTKDAGQAGGLMEKLSAAEKGGAQVLLIARPLEEEKGHSLEEVCQMLTGNAPKQEEDRSLRFPMFVNLEGRRCLVVGGGKVGLRRARALQDFGADVWLISPGCPQSLRSIRCLARTFRPGDTMGMTLVVAATDDRGVNHAIVEECRKNGIPVNVADCPEECSFFFPAICQSKNLIAGVVSAGKEHQLVAQGASVIRRVMEEMDR